MPSIIMDSPVGPLTLEEKGGKLSGVFFGEKNGSERNQNSEVLKEAQKQLTEYFQGKRSRFDLPLQLEGTSFRKQVWQALQQIPYGQTISYGQLAKKIGNPRAVRAVGGANHHNPISIIIPCHRVIGADGGLTGYGGGLEIKRFLLELEKTNERDGS